MKGSHERIGFIILLAMAVISEPENINDPSFYYNVSILLRFLMLQFQGVLVSG